MDESLHSTMDEACQENTIINHSSSSTTTECSLLMDEVTNEYKTVLTYSKAKGNKNLTHFLA